MKTLTAALLALALSAGTALAGPIEVEDAWARPTLPNRPGVAYALIRNTGEAADRLTGASAAGFGRAELHRSVEDGEVMRMEPVEALEIGPGAEVALAPGAAHLMLFDAAERLRTGDRFRLTLEFERAGPVEVTVTVGSHGQGGGHSGHGAGH